MGTSKIEFNTINNSSGYGTGTFENYTTTVAATDIYPGMTYVLKITLPAGTYDEYLVAWIDWNIDGDWTDAGEMVVNTTSYVAYGATYSYNVTVPASATTGTTRLRVSSQYYGMGSYTTNPCGPQYYGDVEDYSVRILALSGFDCAMTKLISPTVFSAPDSNQLTARFMNMKKDTIRWLNLGYQLDNNTPVLINKFDDKGKLKLSAGQYFDYTFAQKMYVATKGNHTLKIWVGKVNDSIPDNDKNNDTLKLNFCTGMKGTYKVGPTGDFKTFNLAYQALSSCGIVGPIIFDVAAGTYAENLILKPVLGMSATNTVTFKGANKTGVVLSSSASAVLDFDAASYFIFKNMTITSTGYCVAWFHNNATYNSIDGCILNANANGASGSSTYNAVLFNGSVSYYNTTGQNGSYNIISNNDIIGGYVGVSITGQTYNNMNSMYNKIMKNNFVGQYYSAYYEYYASYNTIEGNKITGSKYTDGYGIYCYFSSRAKINGNTLNPSRYGIYLYYHNYYGGDSSFITNNLISNFSNANYPSGITLYYYSYRVFVWHNTVVVENGLNDYNNSYAFKIYYYPTGSNVQNNIFWSKKNAYLISMYYPVGITIDRNNYLYDNTINNGANKYFYGYYTNTVDVKTLKEWNTQFTSFAGDVNSLDKVDPHFVSNTDYHIVNTYPPVKVVNKLQLLIDVDYEKRCLYETAIGADESRFPIKKPVAKFIVEDTVCVGSPTAFVNVADAKALQGYWWFLNGKLKTRDLNYQFTFPNVGIDTISLVVENCGGKDTFTKIIVIDNPKAKPVADFVCDLNLVETSYPVQFYDLSTNCPQNWEWTVTPDSVYDPGLGGNMPSVTYITPTSPNSKDPWISFDYPGTYKVCLKASNALGSSTMCKDTYIVVKPTQWMCLVIMPSVERSLYGYLFDDGGPDMVYSNNANCSMKLTPCASEVTFRFHKFDVAAGDYFRIYEGENNKGPKLWNTTAYPSGITGQMSASTFDTFFSTKVGKMYFEWVTNASTVAAGYSGEWYSKKSAYPAPIAKFWAPDTVCLGVPVNFIDSSQGTGLGYSWDFDQDGFFDAFDPNVSYTYQFFPGTFEILLMVEDCGGVAKFKKKIVVIQPSASPTPDFEADIRKPVATEDAVKFTDLSYANLSNPLGCVDFWEWSIYPDTMLNAQNMWVKSYSYVSGSKNSQNPIIRFEDTGYYSIKLKSAYNMTYDSVYKHNYIYAIKYCRPNVTTLNADIGISQVQITDASKTLLTYTSNIGKNAYNNFTAAASTYLDILGSYTVAVSRNSTYNPMNRKVWIDFNIDGDFEDAGELIGSEGSSNTLSWSKSFTIPANALEGATRMRVATAFGAMANTSCSDRMFGEIEDYRVIIRPDGTPPVITLTDADTVYIPQCNCTYTDKGATAWDNINGSVQAIYVGNNLNCNKYGQYYWRYEAFDKKGNRTEKDRLLIVEKDITAPIITLNGKLVDTLDYKATYVEAGYVTSDACAGVDKVVVVGTVNTTVLGDYEVVYTVYDKNGNTAFDTRKIAVRDLTDPTISLNGYATMDIEVHTPFVDPGVVVSDIYCDDKQVKLEPVITGKVDIDKLGTYNLDYSITDCNGNGPLSVSRVVNVVDTKVPVIVIAPPYKDLDIITIEVKSTFIMPSISVTDNYNTLAKMTETYAGTYISTFGKGSPATALGDYTYTYKVEDESGNSSSIMFTVRVVDTQKPVITMTGDNVINLCRFGRLQTSQYAHTITDNFDTNPTVTVSGTYFTDYLVKDFWGLYTIVYEAKDASNNVADKLTRYVNVLQTVCNISVDENDLSQFVKVFPNPTRGEFNVEVNLPQATQLNISITNMLGEVIKTIEEAHTFGGTYSCDLSNFSDGIYFVNIRTENGTTVQKVTLTK